MCDFSLHAVKSRPVVKGEQLVSHRFPSGTRGFAPINRGVGDEVVAVCLLPGTELSFRLPVKYIIASDDIFEPLPQVARFTQMYKKHPLSHHDALEFPNGTKVLLHFLEEGQVATVLQLPAAPKNAAEAKAQERVDYIG